MWRRVRDADAAMAAAAASAPSKGRGRGRGINKRRAQDPPDGQPTPKKSTRGVDDTGLLEPAQLGPAPAKGLLASAAEAEAHAQDAHIEEESVPASPEPQGLPNGSYGAGQSKDQSRLHAREKSPPLPKNLGEADEYGFRTYNSRGPRERALTSRMMAPPIFRFNDWEIGFRDTYNDSSKGHTRAKRGKYLDTPNNTGMHFDHWCNGYDFSNTEPEDFDEEVVAKHGIHPTYGIFLPTSTNESEEPESYSMPGKPVVFIATPSGRVSYASRSLIPTMNHRRSDEAPLRLKLGASMRRFCKIAEIDSEDVAVSDYLMTDDDWKKKSLGTAAKEMKRRPLKHVDSDTDEEVPPEDTKEAVDTGIPALSVLTYASAFVSAQDVTKAAPPPPKPARYDAIRDVFTDSKPEPAPVQETNSLNLNILAELCNVEARVPGVPSAPITTYDYDYKSPVKKEEGPPPMGTFGSVPPSQRLEHSSPYTYSSSERAFPQPPSSGTLREPSQYPPPIDHRPPLTPTDYKQPPPPIGHDHGYYYHPSGHGMPDPRDPMTGRPVDPYGGSRRLSSYGSDPAPPPPPPPSYPRPYWSQHSPGPPPPMGHPQTPSQHYPAPPPPPSSHSRMSFSQAANNDPLPPLRPPRKNQSLPDEPMHDSHRSTMHGSLYYPPGPSRSYHRGGFPAEPVGQMQPMGSDRMLPNPQQGGQGYMGSPPPGYAPQMLSPTFGNPPGLPGQMAQSPPDTPQGPPGSIHRHRSTPSGSSDAGSNKYRKLQPAPVPAHRNWANKPELKTIPYDHKETGSSAALPSSGPTQIRGWNVNQPRKRSKAEKQERAEAAERDDSR